jgi:uncharacterized lipoprotein YmbA
VRLRGWLCWIVTVVAAGWLAGCAVPHLHSKTGQAFNEVFDKQAAKKRRAGPQMTGEEVEFAMENYRKDSVKGETKSQPATLSLMPLQR